jgi:hypothetical protein
MIELVVDTSTLHRSDHGNVTCIVYFEIDGEPCPDRAWDDFAVTVLGWWCAAAARMARGFSRRERLAFMDGPWRLELDIEPDGSLRGRGMRDSRVRTFGSGDTTELAQSILTGATRVARAIRREGWESAELEGLEDGIETLRSALAGR